MTIAGAIRRHLFLRAMIDPTTVVSVDDMHEFGIFVADEYQRQFHEKHPERSSEIVSSALLALAHDAVIAHNGVGILVRNGWSSAAAPVVRTMLDLTVSMLAIVNSGKPRLAAFRYLHAGYRTVNRDTAFSKRLRSGVRTLLRDRLNQLDTTDRIAAIEFLRDKERAYWFGSEWKTPNDIVMAFGSKDTQWAYRQFSAAAHGGFLGTRVFRDHPFAMDINSRLPSGRNSAVVSLRSSRILIELVCLRDEWEQVGLRHICPKIRELFRQVDIPDDA